MLKVVERPAARRVLRHEIWRRSRLYLVLVAGIVGLGSTALIFGFPTFQRYDGSRALDGPLRLSLFGIAFAIAFVVVRRESADRPHLLQRLPVDPATALEARLQIGLLLGALAFSALAVTEYVAEPTLMHPGFAGRLNSAEVATLERLPGVPLLRFEIDGEITRGLTSELSFAAIGSHEAALRNYGETQRWPHFRQESVPKPGEVVARLTREDWSQLDGFGRWQLRRVGIPHFAEVRVVLERYVDAPSYLSEPWRRDGLFRERRWHLFDRAMVFFGLIYCLVCALSASRGGLSWQVLWPMSLLALHQSQFGYLPGRRTVLFSDFGHQQRPQIPTLGAHQTVVENLVWPCFIIAVCCLLHVLTVRSLRRSQDTTPTTFESLASSYRHGGIARRLELLALCLLVTLFIGSIFGGTVVALFQINPNANIGWAWGLSLGPSPACGWFTGGFAATPCSVAFRFAPPR